MYFTKFCFYIIICKLCESNVCNSGTFLWEFVGEGNVISGTHLQGFLLCNMQMPQSTCVRGR